jgi:polysaccharide export outer membrane protein
VSVVDVGSVELASKIADQIKAKTGLLDAPSATIQIVDYPPVYVVGSVTSPGAYPFKPGLSILQALALSGGLFRSSGAADTRGGHVGMLGDLQGFRDEILRTLGRVARLQAEMKGSQEIEFPSELTADSDHALVSEIMAQEGLIFGARTAALKRQMDSIAELSTLLSGEIDILGQKTAALERNTKLVEDELANIKSLVERGIATVSRRSELERAVAALHSDRLSEVTAAMRARQSLSETTRNGLSLRDQYYTNAATELQQAQASLEKLRIKEEVVKKTLVLTDASALLESQDQEKSAPALTYTIIRRGRSQAEEIAASEGTPLVPGDVVKVEVSPVSKKQVSPASSARLSQ